MNMAYDSLNPITVRRNIKKKFKDVMTELMQVSSEWKHKAIQENDNCLMATFEGMVLNSFSKEEDRVPEELREAIRNNITDILLGQTEFSPNDEKLLKRAKVIIKLVVGSVKKQLSVQENSRVRKWAVNEMAKMKTQHRKKKMHGELLLKVQAVPSLDEKKERMAIELAETHKMNVFMKNVLKELLLKVQAVPSLDEEKAKMAVEIGETHEMNVLLKNVRRELLLKVQAFPSLDEEKERMAIELVELKVQAVPSLDEEKERMAIELGELKVQAVPSLDEEKERMAIELGEEEEVQKKRKEYDKMKVDVKKKPEGRLKRMKRRIRRLFCCVRDEHYK